MKIGVLALQGGFQEHIHHINELGYDGVLVKTVEDLKNIKALIIPGGESTTMGKLLKVTGLLSSLKEMSLAAFNDQCTGTNPRYPLVSELEEIYLKAYYGEKKYEKMKEEEQL